MKKIILLFIILFSTVYTAPVKGNRLEIREPIQGNLVSASERLIVNAQIDGSVISASKYLDINNKTKNIVAAAAEITINEDIQNILVSASKSLTVNGDVGDSIIAACDSMLLTGNAGDVIVAAREVDINGEIGNLYATAERVYISGRVRGNVYTSASKVEFIGDGVVLGKIHQSKENTISKRKERMKEEIVKTETIKKGYSFLRIGALIHSFLGILIISLLLKKSAPETAEKLSKTLFKKGLPAFFIGLFFMVAFPVFIVITIPFFGIYSLGIMSGYMFIFILSKSFLVAALSMRYNYFLSLILVVGLSYIYFFSIAFSILGFGVFLLSIREVVLKKQSLEA